MPLADLPLSDLHLWCIPLATLDADTRRKCHAILDRDETLRHQRFISTEAADQFLVGRALLRCVLSQYAPVTPIDWRFEVNDHGKPRIAADHALGWLSFNVSNTRGMVVCAVCRDCAIGVDVEADSQRYDPEVAKRFFTPNEAAAIESAPPEDRRERFLQTWTLKEAVVKATGMGLSCPLSAFDVEIDADPPRVVFTDRLPEDVHLWQLFGLRLESNFHTAIAVRRPADRHLQLSVEQMPPDALGSGCV